MTGYWHQGRQLMGEMHEPHPLDAEQTIKPTGFCRLHNLVKCWTCRDAPQEYGPVGPPHPEGRLCAVCVHERAELQTYAALSGSDSQARRDLEAFRCPHQLVFIGGFSEWMLSEPARHPCGCVRDDDSVWAICTEHASGSSGSALQYGVKFNDGSVMHRWNGRTQEQRAREELAACRAEYSRDNITLVVRTLPDGPWREVDDA